MINKETRPRRILIIGAGFAGTYTFEYLHKHFHKNPSVELALVDRHNYFLFTPLLHEAATGGQTPVNIVEPLRQTLCCLEHFYLTEVQNVNLDESLVETGGGLIPYDYLVIALGATTNFYDTPGAAEHTFTLKSLPDAVALKNHIIGNFETAARSENREEQARLLHYVVIGGGPTGVELAAEMADLCCQTFAELYAAERLVCKAKITLLQSAAELLPQFPVPMRRLALRALQRKGIQVRLNTKVIHVDKNEVELKNGEILGTNTPIWVAGVKPQGVAIDPMPLKENNGRFSVNKYWQLPNYDNVFVLGDMAAPASALAQAATKEAKAVGANIYRLINNKPLKAYSFRSSGDLVSLGRWNAVGQIMGITISGKFAWCVWRTNYLFKMLSWQKKIKVALDWTINLFSPRDISEL